MEFISKFKRFGGEYIPNVIEYLKHYLDNDPLTTITIGCDSIQKRRKTVYAITIMLYNGDMRNGAHVIFFREYCSKIRDTQLRLYKEAQYLYDIGSYIDKELSSFYTRKDLSDLERKKYKYHLLKCSGKYLNIELHREDDAVKSLVLSAEDMTDFKLVDLHVDFNPFEGSVNDRGVSKNRSYLAYKSYIPWLRGVGFRTWCKPLAYGATSAADLLLKNS